MLDEIDRKILIGLLIGFGGVALLVGAGLDLRLR